MADEIVAVYRAEVEQYKKAVDDLTNRINALDKAQNKVGDDAQDDFGKGSKAVGGMSASVTSLTTQMKGLAAAVGIAFTVDRVISFARESVKLAASAEGVERAFKRIGSPQILDGLRKATRGTVSDLQLMQNAVKASNFDIPLENLASLFQFAQARARETGESVDYLVDSIILGIGRKSPLILDNLGISAVQLREKFAGLSAEQASVGDIARAVGEIASEAMAEIGVQADTTADKLAQLSVAWDKISMVAGKALVNLGTGFAYLLGLLDDADPRMTGFMKALEGIRSDRVKDLASGYRDLSDIYVEIDQQLKKVQGLEQELINNKAKWDERKRMWIQTNAQIQRTKELTEFLIPAEKARLDMLREVFEQEKKRKDNPKQIQQEIRNVYFLTNAIKALKDEREQEVTSVARIYEIKKLLPPLEEELKRLLEDEKVKVKELTRSLNDLAAAFEETMKMRMDAINAFYDEQQIGATREIADAQERARVLEEIERNRLREQITLLQGFGLAATSERLKLAQSEAKILDDADALYKRFLEGQDADYMASMAKRKTEAEKSADAEKRRNELMVQLIQEGLSTVANIYGSINQMAQQSADFEMQMYRQKFEEGLITREQLDAKERQLQADSAQRAKDAATFNAIIGAAQATINALSSPGVPFPIALAFSLFAAATAGVQVAAIQSAQVPQFATGVIGLQGAGTETSDSIMARLSKGESVMTAAETKKYRPLLEGMRKGTLEDIIQKAYVRPAIDAAMLSGLADMGRSAELNGLTAKLSDHNIIAAMDRNRSATVYGLKMLAEEIKANKRRADRNTWN
jgi:hypothetical protein